MKVEAMRRKHRRLVREIEPGVQVLYPTPLSRRAYQVPDEAAEQHIHTVLNRADLTIEWAGILAVSALALTYALVPMPVLFVVFTYAAVGGIWLVAMALAARQYAVRRATRDLALVTDARPLWARFVAAYCATRADAMRLLVSVVLVIAGLCLLASTYVGTKGTFERLAR